MKAVLSARLATLLSNDATTPTLFSPATLTLLTMKIASQTGDIRTVLSVARRSLDLAVAGSTSSSTATVTTAHILAALKASHTNIGASQKKSGAETVTRVRNLGLQARFALAALLLATRRIMSGLSLSSNSGASSSKLKENINHPPSSSAPSGSVSVTIDITTLHGFYATLLSRGANSAFCGVGRTEFTDLIGLLEGSGLVELAQGRGFGSKTKVGGKNKGTQVVRIADGVRMEEMVRGLVGSSVSNNNMAAAVVDVIEEEVKHVWEKEISRINREVKAKFGNTNVRTAEFEGAEED